MAESTGSWPWLYQPGPDASKALTEAHKELIEDEADLADLDFTTDDFPVKIKGCVTFSNGSVVEKTPEDVDNDFEVNYKQQNIKLPGFVAKCYSVDPCIKAENIRYATVMGGVQQGVICNDQVLLLSVWKLGRQEIVNAFLRMPGIKETLILASSVLKLIYEGSAKIQMRLKVFTLICSGDTLMSSCSVEERDARELIEFEKSKKKVNIGGSKPHVQNGTLESDSVKDKEDKDDEELKPLKEDRLFFMLDKEALSLYEHPLCSKPVTDFRFYKEPEENVIDVIYLSNNTGELEIERQQKVFYFKSIKKDAEDFAKLSKVLREGKVKPIPKEAFSDLQSFEKHEKDQLPQPKLPNQANNLLNMAEGRPNVFAPPPDQRLPPQQQQPPQWLNLLSTGSHLNNGDEELQVMWFTAEHELEKCIRTNSVPDLSNEFKDTNPNDFNHLLTVVEQIRDKLMSNEYNRALSLLRGIVSVFGKTFLKDVAHLNESELLKRIFFITE